ncbi:MAG: hypothetical protein KGJ23_09255 [Euryarchaeota archaeon]|nr:hypothetical protein [Euryarchaeota archaeon]MDE1836792.1 hypothetical protein [Euryarchaeota archaeon]MDE1881109.1 hypothetical protein [Euryarchaeota archaeon]MDE2044776.1 hypothetical protein [Thermoplasmata archaeon]
MTWDPQTYSFDRCSSCAAPVTELLVVRTGEVADDWLCAGCAGRFRSGLGALGANQVIASTPLRVSEDPLCPYHQGAEANACKLHRWGNRVFLTKMARKGSGRNVGHFPGVR